MCGSGNETEDRFHKGWNYAEHIIRKPRKYSSNLVNCTNAAANVSVLKKSSSQKRTDTISSTIGWFEWSLYIFRSPGIFKKIPAPPRTGDFGEKSGIRGSPLQLCRPYMIISLTFSATKSSLTMLMIGVEVQEISWILGRSLGGPKYYANLGPPVTRPKIFFTISLYM